MRAGSLFSGYGGLDLAVEAVLGSTTVWHAENAAAPAAVLAKRWPSVPNLGDITAIDWSAVEPVEVVTLGFPCQDVSAAGRRAGMRPGTRSGLWTHAAHAIDRLRPRLVVIENVRGLLYAPAHSDVEPCPWCLGDGADGALRALGAVLGDLAVLGYDARVCGLRASDVGAPHERFRVFAAAYPRGEALGLWPGLRTGDPGRIRRGRPDHDRAQDAAAHAYEPRLEDGLSRRSEVAGPTGRSATQRRCASATPDAQGDRRHQGGAEPARLERGPDAAERGASPAADTHVQRREGEPQRDSDAAHHGAPFGGDVDGCVRRAAAPTPPTPWGSYAPAIAHWERVLGRGAPAPTEPGTRGGARLSPRFVEWLMGLPAGFVTDVPGITRNEMLRALGNGVVPQQAAAAITHLLTSEEELDLCPAC